MAAIPSLPYVWTDKPSKSIQLVQRVLNAGGSLTVNPVLDGVNYGVLIHSANAHGRAPAGKRLAWAPPERYGYRATIRLEDLPAWLNATLEPVPIPVTVPKGDPVVQDVAEVVHEPPLVAAARKQAHLVISALTREAQLRGYQVRPGAVPGQPKEFGFRRKQQIHFTVTVAGQHIALALRPDDAWTPGTDYPRNSYEPGKHFTLCVLNGEEHRQSGWPFVDLADAPTSLAQILQEIELRAAVAEAAEIARAEKARLRHVEWSKAMDLARHRWREQYLADVLRQQASDWQLSQSIGAYLSALDEVIPELEESGQSEAQRWHLWATGYRNALDPLHHGVTVPRDREATSEELKQFLEAGWSPHGPER